MHYPVYMLIYEKENQAVRHCFPVQVIHDVAQNILSFLKANCTKEGHTYWLFKGSGEDVVKLYDLTSVCYDKPGGYEQNPFSTPVAILLYQ